MGEREFLCVQELTAQPGDLPANFWISHSLISTRSINFIAYHRVLQPGQVDADLMRAAGLQINIEQREAIKTLARATNR